MNDFASTKNSGLLKDVYSSGKDQMNNDSPIFDSLAERRKKLKKELLPKPMNDRGRYIDRDAFEK